jgi:hypothetical protein
MPCSLYPRLLPPFVFPALLPRCAWQMRVRHTLHVSARVWVLCCYVNVSMCVVVFIHAVYLYVQFSMCVYRCAGVFLFVSEVCVYISNMCVQTCRQCCVASAHTPRHASSWQSASSLPCAPASSRARDTTSLAVRSVHENTFCVCKIVLVFVAYAPDKFARYTHHVTNCARLP